MGHATFNIRDGVTHLSKFHIIMTIQILKLVSFYKQGDAFLNYLDQKT